MNILLPVIIAISIGFISGFGLAIASKFMTVPVDERQEKIRNCLPGANCGACGYSGCDGYSSALSNGEAAADKCTPGGENTAMALSEILGVKVNSQPMTAFIACQCDHSKVTPKYSYLGMMTCSAANSINDGPLSCQFGCIGFGDCINACQFDAIKIIDNKPVICEELCLGCGLCAKICPKQIINIIPKGKSAHILCSNKSQGAEAAKVCSASCVSCMLCVKNCPSGAISIKDNFPVIDYSLCIECGKCKEVCKRSVII